MALRVTLFGPLRVTTDNGEDITPRSAKARGMIALLCTSKDFLRSRSWLQAHLWSDRGREQSSGSLRQTLTETRRAFGQYADCIIAGRQDVQLSATKVKVDGAAGDREFLEGIDVRDEQFEDWLRVERSRQRNSVEHARDPLPLAGASTLFIQNEAKRDGMEAFFSEYFADSIAKNLDEFTNIAVLRGPTSHPSRSDLLLRTSASFSAGLTGLRVSMERAANRQNLWSGAELIPTSKALPMEDEKLLRLVNQASEGICEALFSAASSSRESWDVAIMERRAIRLIFGMQLSDQWQADDLLKRAYDLQPRASHLAWRAMLRLIMLVEAHDGLPAGLNEEAISFARMAVELEPLNSLVMAAAANVAFVFEADNIRGLEFAERAVRANPANPFAIDALSMAALYHGFTQKAKDTQRRARFIAGKTQFTHWFDMGYAKMAAATGDYATAKSMALRSSASTGSFRPPLRYLIVLYLHSGEFAKAEAAIKRLKTIEPGFELDRIWDDDAYPVRDLRRSDLFSKDMRKALD